MSRPPRFSYAHAVHHVTLRCNNREFRFFAASSELFLAVLREARATFPIGLCNHCLMTNPWNWARTLPRGHLPEAGRRHRKHVAQRAVYRLRRGRGQGRIA